MMHSKKFWKKFVFHQQKKFTCEMLFKDRLEWQKSYTRTYISLTKLFPSFLDDVNADCKGKLEWSKSIFSSSLLEHCESGILENALCSCMTSPIIFFARLICPLVMHPDEYSEYKLSSSSGVSEADSSMPTRATSFWRMLLVLTGENEVFVDFMSAKWKTRPGNAGRW